jgi:hypothetical protein
MDKEKVITIVVGLAVGILATGGYFAAIKILPGLKKPGEQMTLQPKVEDTPKETPALPKDLDLSAPADHSATSEATIVVAGKAGPAATVIVFANADEKVATTDAEGNFSTIIKLEEGDNEISAAMFSGQNPPTIVKRNVTLEISP